MLIKDRSDVFVRFYQDCLREFCSVKSHTLPVNSAIVKASVLVCLEAKFGVLGKEIESRTLTDSVRGTLVQCG